MKEWKCFWCGRYLGADRVLHRCKGTLRKRMRFTFYMGEDNDLIYKNVIDYHKFKEKLKEKYGLVSVNRAL